MPKETTKQYLKRVKQVEREFWEDSKMPTPKEKIEDWGNAPIQITFNGKVKEKEKHSEDYLSAGFTKESYTGAQHPNDGSGDC